MLGETIGTISITQSGYLITRTLNVVNNTITEFPDVVIFHIHLISTSTASHLTIQNGQGGTTYLDLTGTISKGIDFDFGMWGVTFPKGAYATVDGNIVTAQITCKASKF